MSYIGYTSVISGGDSDVVFDYVKWNYGADESDTDVVDYPLGYFFSGDSDDERIYLKFQKNRHTDSYQHSILRRRLWIEVPLCSILC